MAQARPSNQRTGRRIIVSDAVSARAPRVDRRPPPVPARPASEPPRVAWSVFAVEPDGKYRRVETGHTAQKALDRARQLWAAEQDRDGPLAYAAGLWRPSTELAEQEVREVNRWILDGRPKPWDYD